MEALYATPRHLVEGLQRQERGARAALGRLLRPPLTRLMRRLIEAHQLPEAGDLLVHHALHAVETHLRTRPLASLAGRNWQGFLASLLLYVGKQTQTPHAGHPDAPADPVALPESTSYHSRLYFRPYQPLGGHRFGGDWVAGHETPDGAFWVLLADVTGHGYYAYLLATGLPGVWEHAWAALDTSPGGVPAGPADLLGRMHHLLEDCLPEGVFLECTLARLAPDGAVTVSPAGASRLLLRRGASRPDLVKLRGTWLGLLPPSREDQHTCTLGPGDELLLATDGVYDQLDEDGTLDLPALLSGPLFESVRGLLDRALAGAPQKDDLTMILLRRRVPLPGNGTPLPANPADRAGTRRGLPSSGGGG